ncbi:MAG: ABC transporter substrate-binding protein [Clostridium sp.]|nr:ABC transporter substrate-binding protein [Clostridium sp.]
MKKKSLLSGVIPLLLSVALCACGGDKGAEAASTAEESRTGGSTAQESSSAEESSNTLSEGTPVPGGSVIFGMTQDLASLDPHVETDAGTRDVVFNLYEGLVKPTSTGDLMPAVASGYTVSDDAKVYTFTLRDGITFHDGTPVTIEDVKYSIDRYAEIQGESSAFSIVADASVKDEKTIEVTLKESYSEFLPMMTLAVIPQANEDPVKSPVGTGPFKFVSYAPGQNIVLEKYDGYWQEGVPSLDTVQFKFIADVDAAYMELQAGTIDILKYLTTAQAQTISPDYNIVEGSMNLVHGMYLNSGEGPLSDTRVRQALCYGVDRDAINGFIFGGKSRIIGSHMIPNMTKYYEPEAENVYSYDPEKAKSLLAEAGYADGFDLVITVPSSYSQHVDTAQIIADQLSQIGVRTTLNQVDWSTWLEDVYKGGNFEATVIGFDGTMVPSDLIMKYVTGNSKNFMHYSNEEYDNVFEEAFATIDDAKKVELYKECQMILARDAAAVFIEDPANLVAVRKNLAGYTFYPTAAEDMAALYQTAE